MRKYLTLTQAWFIAGAVLCVFVVFVVRAPEQELVREKPETSPTAAATVIAPAFAGQISTSAIASASAAVSASSSAVASGIQKISGITKAVTKAVIQAASSTVAATVPAGIVSSATRFNDDVPSSLVGDMRSCDEIVAGNPFYQDKYLQARREQKRLYQAEKNAEADELNEIACFPSGIWLTASDLSVSTKRIREVLAMSSQQNKIPVFVLYSQPDHTTAQWWNGLWGERYSAHMTGLAEAIGTSTAWVIIEPDAIGLSANYSDADRDYRLREIRAVVRSFKDHAPNTRVYLDAGHSHWKTAAAEADLLRQAGIAEADGFVTNISNYQYLKDEVVYGVTLSKLVGNKPFIVDTARNGVGSPSDKEWCNAPGRALGVKPTMDTGNRLIHAFFWVKPPGESDGTCNGGPTPGKFWLDYAFALIRNIPR